MQALIEEFGQYLRHERGQSEHTQKAYSNILTRFANWSNQQSIKNWNEIEFTHLLGYLKHQRKEITSKSNEPQKKPGRPRS